MDRTIERNLDQVDWEIQVITSALSRTSDDDPDMRLFLIGLASAHYKRFDLQHELDDIQKVIEYHSIALALTPDHDSSVTDLLSKLGIAHGQRFMRLGDKHDMEKMIEYQSLALELTPEGHPDLRQQLTNLALSHRIRFEHLGECGDIQNAIECGLRAVEMTPENHPSLPRCLEGLGTSYSIRFRRFGELNDLERAIDHQSRALASLSDDHPHFTGHLVNLAVSYNDRFQRLGELRDLEQAIEYESRVLALTPDDHPDLPGWLGNIARSHSHRFQHLGELRDMEKAIAYNSRALNLIPSDHPHFPRRLTNLAASHKCRFRRLGELSDLDYAIKCESRALALTPDDHPELSGRLANLVASHSQRFGRLGELNDLEQAIDYGSRALALTPDDHPELSRLVANLSASHSCRFERLDELSDLEQAINHGSRAIALTPDRHPDLPDRLVNLSLSHRHRFQRLEKPSDLEQAIDYGSRALALTPNSHPGLPDRLANLAVHHKIRFRYMGELSDLEQAIEYESRALAAITWDHPHSCLWHFNHALSYVHLHEYLPHPSHLQQALVFFRTAHTSSAGPPRDKFMHARRWASHASKHEALNPIEAFQATIDLLPQFIWLGATTDQRYQDLKSVQTLAADAAHAAIISVQYSLALEWLEHARCVVWNQNLMLRSPLDQLSTSHPALATHLQTVADELCTATSSSRDSQAFSLSLTSEQVGQEHRMRAKEYEELLAQARAHPGFENLLRPMKAAGLIYAAQSGPIVVINCHKDRSDALLVSPGQSTVTHLTLPSFSSKKARDAHSMIQLVLSRQGIRERGFRVRKESDPHHNFDFKNVLKLMWIDVVKPVLDFLGYTTHPPTGSLPHITWCPTGVASFLPLHAAGDYDQPCSRAFDYVVSSYTPTLTALLGSNWSTFDCNSRVLVVGQAATPNHSPLPGTTIELEYVKSNVKGRARYSELVDAEATPTTVLNAMEEHDWVHLACHAHQNVHDPTKSGFFLHGGTLDLAAISRRSLKKKGLAFLSACQTATGDETLSNEAVHLASGMLMAGYSSVIATMWSVSDVDAPFVADKVYGQLVKKGTLGNGEAGRALHDAVQSLRSEVGEENFGRWVPFIHIGS